MLRFEFDYIGRKSELSKGFESLLPLLGLRDQLSSVLPRQIANNLYCAVEHLAVALKIPTLPLQPELIAKLRSPSEEMQEIRHNGRRSVE
jgi:hypothetical protein